MKYLLLVFTFLATPHLVWADSIVEWEQPTWTTTDGVQLAGFFHPPKTPQKTTWILLHGLGSTQDEWLGFANRLVGEGYGILLYDARGHGKSTKRASGKTIDYREFRQVGGDSQWSHMISDLGSATNLLISRYKISPEKIGLGGASLGANVVLVYASQTPQIRSIFLLSPGLEYAGININQAWNRYGKRPLFIAASPEDAYAFASVQTLIKTRTDRACRASVGQAAEHGVAMLHGALFKSLLNWLKGH